MRGASVLDGYVLSNIGEKDANLIQRPHHETCRHELA